MSIPFGATKTASVNGASLAYREQGGGEPVVFVHGALSDLRSWEHQLPALGRTHRAIAYSRRFHRPNEGIDASVDDPWPSHVDDLVGFLRNVDAAPAHLVGNSQGAFISLLTAIRHPDLARTLVIEEPPVIPLFLSDPPRVAELVRLLVTRPRTAMTIGRFGTGTMAPTQRAFRRGEDDKALRIFGRGVLGEHGYEQLSQERREQMRENLGPLRALMLGAGLPAIRNEDVRAIRSPVLLVPGERSPTVLLRLTDRLEELLPTVERVEIPAASHLMHEDNPPALNEAVAEFLVRHSHILTASSTWAVRSESSPPRPKRPEGLAKFVLRHARQPGAEGAEIGSHPFDSRSPEIVLDCRRLDSTVDEPLKIGGRTNHGGAPTPKSTPAPRSRSDSESRSRFAR